MDHTTPDKSWHSAVTAALWRCATAFVPVAPELDHDIDLTNDPDSPGGAPDNLPAAVTDPRTEIPDAPTR